MDKTSYRRIYSPLARVLERSGYGKDSLYLVVQVLIPLALQHGISIDDAITLYEDGGEDQDTSTYQLWLAMREMSEIDYDIYRKLEIFTPL